MKKINLAHLPTPVDEMPRLTAFLGGPKLLIKRDDQTGLAFGGNKTRKLEYIFADVLAKGANTVVTGGALQSNHCRQTAAAAARLGLDCILVLNGESPEKPSGNLLLDHLFGAHILYTTKENRQFAMERAVNKARVEGKKPYLIPIGGSNALGATAYAGAIDELLRQKISPDWIVFASSSGGTHGGLVAGSRLFGFPGRVLGISIDEPEGALKQKVAQIASDTTEIAGSPFTFSSTEIDANTDYLGAGYGVMGALEKEAIRLFASREGILLDPVYTARAAGGMLDLIRRGFFQRTETVLFWHTGGTPALLAERYRDVLK